MQHEEVQPKRVLFWSVVAIHTVGVLLTLLAGPGEDLGVYLEAAELYRAGRNPYDTVGPPYLYPPSFVAILAALPPSMTGLLHPLQVLVSEVSLLAFCVVGAPLLGVGRSFLFVVCAMFAPVYLCLLAGQVDVVLLLLMTIALGASRGVGVAAVLASFFTKPVGLLWTTTLALQGRWARVGAVVVSLLPWILAHHLLFPEWMPEYGAVLLGAPVGDNGLVLPRDGFQNHSLANLVLSVAGLLGWMEVPLVYVGSALCALGLVWRRLRVAPGDPAVALAGCGALCVLVPPYAWALYLVWLLPMLALHFHRRTDRRPSCALALGILFVPPPVWLAAARLADPWSRLVAVAVDEAPTLAILWLLWTLPGRDARACAPPQPARTDARRADG